MMAGAVCLAAVTQALKIDENAPSKAD